MPNKNQNSFNWSITDRKVILYIPNFGRKKYLIPTLKRMKTTLPRDQWIILVVNDGIHEDMSDLSDFNLTYFTFERGQNPKERNGCMVRNYILKRLQSQIVATRDPEIFVEGSDYLSSIADLKENQVYRPCEMVELTEPDTVKLFNDPFLDLPNLRTRCVHRVTTHNYRAFHAGFAMHTKKLVDLGGYEEEFASNYGYEDVNLLERVIAAKMDFVIDPNVKTYHTFHPRRVRFLQTVGDNGILYKKKRGQIQQGILVANNNKEWGNG